MLLVFAVPRHHQTEAKSPSTTRLYAFIVTQKKSARNLWAVVELLLHNFEINFPIPKKIMEKNWKNENNYVVAEKLMLANVLLTKWNQLECTVSRTKVIYLPSENLKKQEFLSLAEIFQFLTFFSSRYLYLQSEHPQLSADDSSVRVVKKANNIFTLTFHFSFSHCVHCLLNKSNLIWPSSTVFCLFCGLIFVPTQFFCAYLFNKLFRDVH